MITIRPANERGHADHGWLDTRHTFSFADYYDPEHMGFRSLRVINQDAVAPGAGFGTHPHHDMEIVTVVTDGALEHRDSLGNGSVIWAGDVQRMTAGTGVTHSEYNHSRTDPVRFLQIWILPERKGLVPGYEQRSFDESEKKNRLRLIASRDGRDESLTVHQDMSLYITRLDAGASVELPLDEGRHAWLQVVEGNLSLNGERLGPGDGAAVSEETLLTLTADEECEALLFDLG